MLKSEAAAYLAGVTQTEGAEASAPTNLHVITGEVGEASADGKTLVKIDGLMFSESDDQFIEVDALGGLEEGDIATIVLTGEQGHAMTPLALGSIGSVDRITVRITAIEADYVKASTLEADVADIGFLKADSATITNLQADTAKIHNLTADQLSAATAYIADLTASSITAESLTADVAKVHNLTAQQLSAAAGYIAQLNADSVTAQAIAAMYGDFDTVKANAAKVANLTAAELEADHATVGSLSTNYAHITNGVIDNATIGYADVNNLSAHYAEIQNGKIDSALINTAAIVDEQVFTVTGNKATLAQIDASKINVLNLKAKDIEVERINGQPVTNKTLVDALSQHESDISDLDSKIDNEVEALNDRIDGAIETFTGTVVPTLENTPASQWNTVKLKDQHVGDVYYVVNSQSAQNGYCYRFTKSGSTYSWQLIKDSDVTAALSRLQTAEGKIGDIETFDETVGSFMTNTDDEISSLKTKDTQLETSLGDKVSTSTFNTVSQKVDTNEANITSMSTVLTNNGLTSSTNITNTVNSVKQTADTNTSNISSLQTTVSGHTTTIQQHTTSIRQNTDAIALRATKTEVQQVRPAYATSTTGAGTAAKVATIDPAVTGYALYKGASVAVTFSKANTAATPTLNLNSTGAKQIRSYTGAALSEAEYKWAAGATVDLVYDGTYWRMQDGGAVKRVTAAEASISVNAENIESKVSKDGVISSINQSAETVKIQASKVEIDGTAIFSAISSDVDDAITGKGYQTSSQVNSAITSKGYATTTQAQGYASTAKSEAISAAATDAATKANAAETNAKAYTDALEIGGRNLLYDTSDWSKWAKTAKAMATDNVLTCTNTDTSSGFQRANGWFIPDKADVMDREIVISFDVKKTDSTELSSLVFQMFTTSAAPRSVASGNINEGTRYFCNLSAKSTSNVTILNASEINATTWTRVSIGFVPSQVFNTTYTEQAYLAVYVGISNKVASAQFRHIKAEYGNKATDWSPAPEDTPQYRVVTTSYSYTLAQWLTWSAEGYTGSWSTGTSGQGVRAGDTVMLKGINKDNGSAVYVLMTVNTLNSSGAISNATSHGLIDPTAGQRADSIQVGGRNLLKANDALITPTLYNAYDLYVTDPIESGQPYVLQLWDVDVSHSAKTAAQLGVNVYYCGGSMALGGWVGTNYFVSGHADHLTLYFTVYTSGSTVNSGGNISGSANVLSHSSVTNTTKKYIRLYNSIPAVDGTRNMSVGSWKLEKGNKATDWTPAPEDQTAYVDAVQVGGRNLLQDSDQVLENGSVLDTKTLFACFLWSTPAKGYTGYKQIMPNTNVNSVGRFALTFEAMDVSQEYWCIKHNGTQHDYVRYFKNSVDVKQGDVLTLSFDVVKFNPSLANGLEIKNFKLERGNKATDWTPAPEDIEANAVKRTQRIYYRSSVSTAPATMPTAWVTETNNKWAKNNSTVANWSTKVTPIANGTGATATKYLYLWTCEQREMANGTLAYTNVLLDDSTTVIDGGNIITNSITANQIAANAVTADKLAANSLTIGKFTDADKAKVDNSYMQVGGRNLLHGTSTMTAGDGRWDTSRTFRASGGALSNVTTSGLPIRGVSGALRVTNTGSSAAQIGFAQDRVEGLLTGETYTQGAWVRASTTVNVFHQPIYKDASRQIKGAPVSIGTDWTYISHTGTLTGTQATDFYSAGYMYASAVPANGWFEVCGLKLEKGNKATDWTPAPEDQTDAVDQTYVQNLTPYFQMDMTQTSDEYWANLTYEHFNRLGDGWAHFEYTNSGTKTANNYIKLTLLDFLEPGGKYTLLAEFKNVSISADGGSFYSQQGNDVQVWGAAEFCGFAITNAEIRALSGGAGAFYKTLTLLTADSKDPSGTVRGSLPKTSFMSINQQVQVNQTVSYDLRLSLYAAGYTGVYKPYVGSQLYATGKSLSDSQDFLDERIDGLDDRTTNAENSLETTSEGLEKAVKDIESLNKKYTDEKALRDQWMDFTRSEGLVIGDNKSEFKTVIGSESMEFKNGDLTLAKASGTEFGADVMRSEELHIGKWMWTKRNEGNNLSLKWVGN